jgi:hypothetical protein
MNASLNVTRAWFTGNLLNFLSVGLVLGLTLILTACNSTTILLVNFNSDTVGSQPSPTQATGTVGLEPGSGTITVVDAPASGLTATKWVSISHPTQPTPQTGIKCNVASGGGAGNFGLLASVYIPSGTGVVTVQFERSGGVNDYAEFLHVDFMPQGDLRINDDPNLRFGQFPRDQSFVLSVNLVITAASATATVSLLGANTSGSRDVNITALPIAQQFGAVRFWMGYQWTGTFYVDDIIVSRRNP